MNANDIRIGTKLEIELPEYNKNDVQDQSSYISQMLDVVDETTISVAAPMSEGRFKYLSRGLNVVIYFLNDRHEFLYFKGIIKGHRKIGPLDAFDLTFEGDITKIQRRQFYRLETTLKCQYNILEEQVTDSENYNFPEIDNAALKSVYTKNISGSGFCIILDEALDKGTIADITINLEDIANIRVLAKAIRSIKNDNKKYEVGMKYIKILPQDAALLTRFIFEKQRLMLKNSMHKKIR